MASPPPCVHRWTYDVFVSFRGEDIRKNFMDHLFSDFRRKGIHAFRDDERLSRGEEISSGLYKAIEESKFLVVIFSKNYASSTWCLRELVKILDCKEKEKDEYEVRTIFYDVKPEVVRKQIGCYGDAFRKHGASNNIEIPIWKEALVKAASLSGWDLQDMTNGRSLKTQFMAPWMLVRTLLDYTRVEQMDLLQFVGSNNVHMIGICGFSGVGKTTIAIAIYNLLYNHFEGSSSFCEDVAKLGLVHLQKQLLDDVVKAGDLKIGSVSQGISVMKKRMGSKRVLIVLDDVDDSEQFEALAGMPNWYGPGSMIIVTGKDRQLLSAHGVEKIYEVDLLNDDESLELFSLYAFREKCPNEGFVELSSRVVHYVKGHPLSLKILGRFLFRKTVREWESELDKLARSPHAEVQQVLRLSYDGLDPSQESIFLDIACFFKGEKSAFVTRILESCELFPDTDIRVLVDKCLITISRDRLQMHDLLQEMGRQVVHEESEDPGRRSRLWSPKDVRDVLNKNKGTAATKGLVLNLSSASVQVSSVTFAGLTNLRLLKLFYELLDEPGNSSLHKGVIREDSKVGHSRSLEFLSNELRWLFWHGYPFEFLPSTFYPESLVALNMSFSPIKELWAGSKGFGKLTLVELRHCYHLTKTPDFTEIPNLEELILEGCTNLVELHPSIGVLKGLIVLNLKGCKNLRIFPSIIELESLQILILSGCSKVDKLPEDVGKMKSLVELRADGTAIKKLPSSIVSLDKLQVLSLGSHEDTPSKSWSSIFWPSFLLRKAQPSTALVLPSLSNLRLMRNLDVSHCSLPGSSLNDICHLSLLETLNLSGNDFVSLPANFNQLSRLTALGLVRCKNLQRLPELPSKLIMIDAQDCSSLEELPKPSTMHESSSMRFDFSNCQKLAENKTIESLANMLLPQGRIDPYKSVNLFLPGSSIPAWFIDQSIGNRVRVALPLQWCYGKFKGIATCAVFSPKNPMGSKGRLIEVSYSIRSLNNAVLCGIGLETRIFPNEIRSFGSDQVWLSYMVPRLSWEYRWEAAKDYIEVEFDIFGICSEVKECGVRLIYDEDEGQSSSRMIQWMDISLADNEALVNKS